jgi:2,4-dienoyl-CoA reductase-like NADH-dependent reductase (Old Yellow Enzyme family)
LDLAGVFEVQASFARAAANAERLGFKGVELHNLDGSLIGAFLSEVTDQRTGAFGVSFDKRLRLAVEMIEQPRQSAGENLSISFGTSQWIEPRATKRRSTPDVRW